MLRLSANINNVAIMSLRTGGKVATALEPIINARNLKVEGWYCDDVFSRDRLILLSQDVRDFVPQGIAINDHADLVEAEDLIRLKEVMDEDFSLIGKIVVTSRGRKMGKIADYALETGDMKIHKLYVSRPVYRSLSDGQLSIDRSQIVEVTNRKIVVRDVDVKVANPSTRPAPAAS